MLDFLFLFFEIYNENFFYLLFFRICCLYYFCVMVNIFFKVIVGYRNLNKAIVPCVITMAEESMHSDDKTRGGPYWEGRAS